MMIIGRRAMNFFFRITFTLCLILAILIGCENNNEPFNQGIALLEKRQYDRAIAFFNEALEINPGDAKAYCNRGWAYAGKSQYDKAISDYTRAIEINSRYADAYINRGWAYHYTGQYDKAYSDWSRAYE